MIHKGSTINVSILLAIFLTLSGCHSTGRDVSVRHHKDTATVYIHEIDFHPVVNVYLENSGSMDGYLTGITEFEEIVYNFLTDIKIERITDELNLFYINSRILPQRDDIDDFIKRLEPTTFRTRGGNRGTTDIAQMIDSIMAHMNDSSISIFISDCIFSPGKGRDAQEYLANQEIAIKKTIGTYFNSHPRFSIIGYQCFSSFNGTYYDRNDHGAAFKGRRPFYIWMMGTQGGLRRITMLIPPSRFHGEGIENTFVAFAAKQSLPDSNYVVKPGSGAFKMKRGDSPRSIRGLKKDKSGSITFAINAHLSPLLLSEDYLMNPQNYVLDNNHYRITKIERILRDSKYSYSLKFEADRVTPTELNIYLRSDMPLWVEQYNDEEGSQLDDSTKDKTFGLRHLINGFSEGIVRGNDYYTHMNINIIN